MSRGGGQMKKNSMIKHSIRNKINNCFWNFVMPLSVLTKVYASDAGSVESVFGEIMGVLLNVGIIVALVKMVQIGIQFMFGAASGKNQAKTALIPWAVGLFICITFKTIGSWVIGIVMSGSGGGVFDI